ncbi:MAG: hypothetical protein AUG91_01990 [Actinobacteria bacterium 13_1_20CM_4_69_9]|nr:MAG: hypothetical protein AUG91_01990 [Actinobacteria bacterium 13_1_20CM_4_69_9]
MVRRVAIVAALVMLAAPAVARANGDPASDYLLVQSIFLPFNAKVDPSASKELTDTIRAANEKGFKVRVAVIGSRYDLGTAFSLYNNAEKYAEFLGLELSFQYHDGLLVVMPNGYGYSVAGKPDPKGIQVVKDLPPPGKDATAEVQGATRAIRKLAAASGHQLPAGGTGGGSKTRDRITIATGAITLATLLAAIVFWHRDRRRPAPE